MPEAVVATLNLFNNAHGRWAERAPLVAEQLVELAPDVIALQEVDAHGDQVPALVEAANRALPAKPYTAVTLPNPNPESIKSLAVLTRLPLGGVDTFEDLEGGDIALHVALAVDGATLDLFTTHLHYGPSREGGDRRRRQVDQLLAWIDAASRAPVVLCGDFNSVPTGTTVARVKERFRSAHEVANGTEAAWTHPTPLVYSLDAQKVFGVDELPRVGETAIDYVFVSDSIDVHAARVVFDRPAPHDDTLYPSDHLGVMARITVH